MSETSAAKEQSESVVVAINRLDTLLDLAGKVIIVSSNLEALRDRLEEQDNLAKEVYEESKDLASTASRISSDLHHLVIDVRHVSMNESFARFRRLARDVSRRVGKPIHFEVEGGDVTLDKIISEKIYDPIAHQIRNAIVHGIENPDVRMARGKDPVGRIRLEVEDDGQLTTIVLSDDGGGIDLDAVRSTAEQRGLATREQLSRMDDDELYQYLFMAGFSTVEQTSNQAGRGVGMDVVRTVLDSLDAECRIESRTGVGSKFTFLLPNVSAVNISDTLMVAANDTHYAFPIASVLASVCIEVSKIRTIAGQSRVIPYLNEYLPLEDLGQIFGESPVIGSGADRIFALIVQHKRDTVAFQVSEFLSPQKVVISALDEEIAPQGIQGVAVLSGQRLGMVVDVQSLFDRMRKMRQGETPREREKLPPTTDDDEFQQPEPSTPEKPQDEPAHSAAEPSPDAPGEAFLHELKTMLSSLNRELLQLDESRDRQTTDSVFRLIHSIKGNLAMCGLDEPADITHHLESLLDRAREGIASLEDSTFDMFFDGCEYLEGVVGALLQGEAAPAPTERLAQAIQESARSMESVAGDLERDDADGITIALDPLGEFQLSSRRMAGARLVQAELEFDPGDQPAFLVAYIILRRFEQIGAVIGTSPPIERISSGVCGSTLRVLFVPSTPGDARMGDLEENLRTYFGVLRLHYEPYC